MSGGYHVAEITLGRNTNHRAELIVSTNSAGCTIRDGPRDPVRPGVLTPPASSPRPSAPTHHLPPLPLERPPRFETFSRTR